ncbi:MAG: translation elongation factor Ts [Acidimicrobiia bacterium]|nr:translation elongation factor Ts [Actinomycetota bacterium]MBL6923884.1 translation elongation factor Ts [Acidimicrobiia bacterium]MBL6926375.1 translation elongation factor Ts [Acidimicrobiia bacterium]
MTEISAKDVKALRDATGAGMMDAKRALVEVDGDFEAATQFLREKGLAKAATRSDRENVEGVVGLAIGEGRAALVHLKCETDFSAKSERFLSLANELAEAVLVDGEAAVDARAAELDDLRLAVKENVELGVVRLVEASEGNTIDTYLHLQDGRGVNGVIVEGEGIDQETLHQVALHVAFAKPSVLSREDVDPERVEAERTALLEITKAEGKPEPAWEKIVEGRLTGWFREMVLLEQGLHGDKVKVADSLNGGRIVGFTQAYLGA